ncbi:hypothetical protein KP509_06G079700 [Ceratopteris richardii]|nr:hypothetical protein KP509_06G079700 [Ceratopteris richardii]
MYVKCGELEKAETLLYLHKSKLAFAWTAVIAGYTHQGRGQSALDCFKQMQHEGILPNSVTYKCALKACALIKSTDIGRDIHKKVSSRGLLQEDPGLGNALVNMYVKCRAISDAQKVLEELSSRDVVSWNILISGYIQEDEVEQALDCVEQMQHKGILPDLVTYVSALKACAKIRAIEMGRHFHQEITMQGLLQNNIELGGALVNMYAKCGKISEAQRVLEELPFRDVISWSALIAGYVEEGQAEQALKCSDQMQHEGIVPDAVTFVYMLRACAILRETKRGRRIHVEIVRQGLLQNDIILGNALVDMYAKCGEVSVARCILEELPFRDVVSWNTLIAGYVQEGELEHALNCFEWMQIDGILPDAVTCACVLNVCSQQGLIQKGQTLFMNMITKYGVKPSLESYTCMIALFGHAGHLEKAVRLVQEVSAAGSTTLWHALMGSCQKSADVNVAEWVFEQAESLDKSDESAYVLLGNIYAAASLEGQVKRLEGMRIRNCY